MIHYVLTIFLIFSGLMMLPGSQIIPTTLAQENSITETNATNTSKQIQQILLKQMQKTRNPKSWNNI